MTEDRGGPLDVATLEVLARRADAHPLVERWRFRPDALSPRTLELSLDADRYPRAVDAARLDVRWFEGGDYTIHYLERRGEDTWQCRWDRHPKPGEPDAHFHPPPDADASVAESEVRADHPLGVLFAVLDLIDARIVELYGG